MGACHLKTAARGRPSFPQLTERFQQPPATRAILRIHGIIEKHDLNDSKFPLYLQSCARYVPPRNPFSPPSLEASANLKEEYNALSKNFHFLIQLGCTFGARFRDCQGANQYRFDF